MGNMQETATVDLAFEIDDAALESLLGDEPSVSRLLEEEVDTSLLPSSASVIVLTIVAKC